MTRLHLEDRGELLARILIDQLFDDLGLHAKHKMRPCPNPPHAQTGATPPVSLEVTRGLWKCHGCGEGGSAVDAVRLAKGLSVAESFDWLRSRAGMHRPEPRPLPAPRGPVTERPPPANADELLAAFTSGRGWSPDVVDRCGVHIVTDRRGHPRLRIPYRWEDREEWWQDRTIDDRLPKFVSPTGRPRRAGPST